MASMRRRGGDKGKREKGKGKREKGEGRREKGEGRREKGEGRREKGAVDENSYREGTLKLVSAARGVPRAGAARRLIPGRER